MITGSVGKTSTKDAVAAVLAKHFYLRKSEKSFNSELGVPFTIFGVGNPWHDPYAWLLILREAIALMLLPNHYPAMLVLEVGADRPGDLARIMRMATPNAVVVTRLPEVPVHVEAYTSPEAVREEEFYPAYFLPAGAPLIVSSENSFALALAKRVSKEATTFGEAESADVKISHIGFHTVAGKVTGMRAQVEAKGQKGTIIVDGAVGSHQVRPVAAAIALAQTYAIGLPEALAALKAYEVPAGRGRLFAGIKGATLIDDSYNASPVAVEKALESLKDFPAAKRRIAVLGDMLELGRYSVSEHERIGALAAASSDVVVSVGIRAKRLAEAARAARAGCSFSYDDSYEAAKGLVDYVQPGDVVLIKGSQAIRAERIMEALLADPADAAKLVRQEKEWKRR
jgi:UDP-N-acetylmuramoyl-tripeptide--D-alanyl-D-alanine ligase